MKPAYYQCAGCGRRQEKPGKCDACGTKTTPITTHTGREAEPEEQP